MLRSCSSFTPCLLTAALALLGVAAIPAGSAPSPAGHRNLPDSFLPAPARSVGDVVAQVQADPVVRRHYARYLHLAPARVAPYLRANLVPSRLSHDGLYTVYYVRSNGLIYPTMLTVPKGSPVFALKNGPALLTWNDGNPLVRCRKAARFHPDAPALTAPAPASRQSTVVQQVIVPTSVETTVVPPPAQAPAPAPTTVENGTGQ